MNLKQMRKESGLKAYKVAEMLGISRTQLYNLENGNYKINQEKIVKFSEMYKKSRDEIISSIGVQFDERK